MTHRSMPRFVQSNAFILGLLLGALGTGQAVQAATPKTAGVKNQWATKTVTLSLLQAVEQAQAKGNSFTEVTDKFLPTDPNTQQLKLEIILEKNAELTADDLALKNCLVKTFSEKYGRASVWVSDPSAVLELAKIPGVRTVRPSYGKMAFAGAAMSEAPRALKSDVGVDKYLLNGRQIDGRTIKFGVLSDSFSNTSGVRREYPTEEYVITTPDLYEPGTLRNAKNQDSGDLPPEVEILEEYIGEGGIDEGAGMAELIYDIAPGCAIAFHTTFNGDEAEFAEGIHRLWQEADCDVVVDDVMFYAEPMFQQGLVAQAAKQCVDNGNPYFSSAGNNANYGYHFTYKDANPDVDNFSGRPNGDDFHLWENGDVFLPITVLGGDSLLGITQWNQPFDSVSPDNGSQIDLDIYFYDVPSTETGSIVFSSVDTQGTTGAPFGDALELINVINGSDEPVTYYMAIRHVDGSKEGIPQDYSTPLEIRCIFFSGVQRIGGISDTTSLYGGPTIYGHSIAPGAVSVAAVPWYDTEPFDPTFPPSNDIDPEYFSSRGGNLTVYFDENGNLNPVTNFEPDISAVDGNNTTFFGMSLDLNGYNGEPDQFPNFFGTSASAPNAAAVAGLLLDMDPTLTPADIEQILANTAIDVIGRRADFGIDDVTGPGLIDAEAAIDVVATRIGLDPVVTPSPTPQPMERQTFSFDESIEGWDFITDNTFFSEPDGDWDADSSLFITTTNNSDNFGFFTSPHLVVGGWERDGDIPLEGDPDSDDIYRAIYTIGSDVTDVNAGLVPVVRLRQNSSNFAQSNMVVVTSENAPVISPTETSDKTYRVYFELPENENRFRLNFDVLNAGFKEQAIASLYLRRVVVDSIDKSDLTDKQFEKEVSFAGGNTNGWEAVARPPNPLAPEVPESGADREGLRLGPSTLGDDKAYVGIWGSPENFSNPDVASDSVQMRQDRLYEVTFTVSSSAGSPEDAVDLPNFRLRVNDQSQNLSALVSVESIDSTTALPTSGASQQYKLYFEGREDLDENYLIFSFDYVLPQLIYSSDDPTKTITLESFNVVSYDLPY